MFDYPPGQLWTPHSAAEHSADILADVNAVLKANNILDSEGNLIQFAAVTTNVVWIMALALGEKFATKDLAILAAAGQFDVAEATDDQIEQDLPIAGTQLLSGAYSLVTIRVTADGTGSAVVAAGKTLTFGTICKFATLSGATIPAGEYADILCEADTLGPIAVGVGQLTAFDETIAHVLSVTNLAAAILGRNQETFQQVRQRLIQGNIVETNVDGTQRAIARVQGITDARVYVNPDPANPLVLPGGVSVPKLSAYIVVVGDDLSGTGIAYAYAQRMLAQTYATGADKQEYVSQSGQSIDVKYDVAAGARIYVELFYDPDTVTASGFDTEAQNVVASIPWKIGQAVSAADVLAALIGFPYAKFIGAMVSLDGTDWDDQVKPGSNKYATIAAGDVTVALREET